MIARRYKALRARGECAAAAIRYARIEEEFSWLEYSDNVRIEAVPDADYFYPDWDCDKCDDSTCHRCRETIRLIEVYGVWGIVGEYRIDPESDVWQVSDSIWGCAGYRDPVHDTGYQWDIMEATMSAYRDAVSALVPCYGPIYNTEGDI